VLPRRLLYGIKTCSGGTKTFGIESGIHDRTKQENRTRNLLNSRMIIRKYGIKNSKGVSKSMFSAERKMVCGKSLLADQEEVHGAEVEVIVEWKGSKAFIPSVLTCIQLP